MLGGFSRIIASFYSSVEDQTSLKSPNIGAFQTDLHENRWTDKILIKGPNKQKAEEHSTLIPLQYQIPYNFATAFKSMYIFMYIRP